MTKPETARRVRQRIKSVLDWAKASGFRSGDNPVEGVARGLPRQGDRKQHFAAMSYDDVPAFVRRLRGSGGGEAAALPFSLDPNGPRTSEVLKARWDEIDLKRALDNSCREDEGGAGAPRAARTPGR